MSSHRKFIATDPVEAPAPLQEALDRVAGCAAVSLGAPLASVSLLQADHVALAGMHGFERRRTARRASFCAEVVRLGATLLVDDAPQDARFQQHEFVSEGGVRCYAGAPVRGAGETLGAVGVYGAVPAAFGAACLGDLEALAHMVELLLMQIGPVEIELPRVRRQGWIGVRTLDARRTATAARAGLVVLSVARGSPAAESGLRSTDILYAVDDQVLRERADLLAALADREPGSAARVTFQRAGEWRECWIKVASRRNAPRTAV